MKKILREFYSQDATIKCLCEKDQIMKFESWSKSKGFNLELGFIDRKPPLWFTGISVIILAVFIYSSTYKIDLGYYGLLFPIVIFTNIYFLKRQPILNDKDN